MRREKIIGLWKDLQGMIQPSTNKSFDLEFCTSRTGGTVRVDENLVEFVRQIGGL